jgi:hypothetical protein
MNWRVTNSRCAVSKDASSTTCSSVIAVGGVAKEDLDVVACVVLLLGLLLLHDQADHVGLGHGGVVGRGNEVLFA